MLTQYSLILKVNRVTL